MTMMHGGRRDEAIEFASLLLHFAVVLWSAQRRIHIARSSFLVHVVYVFEEATFF